MEVLISLSILLVIVSGISQIYRQNIRFAKKLDKHSAIISLLRSNPAHDLNIITQKLKNQGTIELDSEKIKYSKTEKDVIFQNMKVTSLKEIELVLPGKRDIKVNYYVFKK